MIDSNSGDVLEESEMNEALVKKRLVRNGWMNVLIYELMNPVSLPCLFSDTTSARTC